MKKVKNYYIMTNEGKTRFKCWLVKKGISMRKFAKMCGVSQNYISLVVNGKSHITPKAREIFARGGYDII